MDQTCFQRHTTAYLSFGLSSTFSVPLYLLDTLTPQSSLPTPMCTCGLCNLLWDKVNDNKVLSGTEAQLQHTIAMIQSSLPCQSLMHCPSSEGRISTLLALDFQAT